MIIKTRGIVFKSIKYSETSLIVDIYTEAKGLRKYIVSGVRSKKAKIKPSLLQVMSLVEMVAFDREDRDLNRIKELRPTYIYQQVPFDLRRGAVGLFMAEVARKTIRESEENPRLFQFLFDTFTHLDRTNTPVSNLHLSFLLDLSMYLGFMPGGFCTPEHPIFDLQEGIFVSESPTQPHVLSDTASQLLSQLLQTSVEDCHNVAMQRRERQLLVRHLLDYYRLHLENFPEINAHRVLQEVLEG
ncbi:MAG: DNA repair protein RecO [Bacteroidota bacterium]